MDAGENFENIDSLKREVGEALGFIYVHDVSTNARIMVRVSEIVIISPHTVHEDARCVIVLRAGMHIQTSDKASAVMDMIGEISPRLR